MKFHVTNQHNGRKYAAQGQLWPAYGWHIQVLDLSPNAWGRATSGVGEGPVIDQGWQKDLEARGWAIPPLTPPKDVRGQEMDRLAKSLGGHAAPQEPPVKESRAARIVARLLEDTEEKVLQALKTGPIRAIGGIVYDSQMKPLCSTSDLYALTRQYKIVRTDAGGSPTWELQEDCGHCDTPTKVTLKPQPIDLSKISPEEKKMGTKVEKEHVVSAKDAIAVAAAHWKEDPNYYAHGKKKGVFPELAEMNQVRTPKFKSNFIPSRTLGELGYGKRAKPSKACWHNWRKYFADLSGRPRVRCIKCGEKRLASDMKKEPGFDSLGL
jgi:hypothetical protein